MARSLSASSAAWAVAAAGGPAGAGAIGRGVGTKGPPQAPENTAATEGAAEDVEGRRMKSPVSDVPADATVWVTIAVKSPIHRCVLTSTAREVSGGSLTKADGDAPT